MQKDTLSPDKLKPRARGVLLGLAALGPPSDLALARVLAEEILQPRVDLERLARRWVERGAADPGLDAATRAALAHLAHHGTPPAAAAGGIAGDGPLAFCLPIGIAARSTLRTLVSGSFHVALLTAPDPVSGWATVAVNVAVAGLLLGRRDVLPEVLDVLRANDAPAELADAIRRVPFLRREELPAPDGSALATALPALWLAHHEPKPERGLRWVAEVLGAGSRAAGVAAALLAARHGDIQTPAGDTAGGGESTRLLELADRLVGAA
jgi:hypothetical protein